MRKDFKKGDSRHYILYLPNSEKLKDISRQEFITIHDTHRGIESYHRAIKQICGADALRPSPRRRRSAPLVLRKFMVRNTQAIKIHIFCSLQTFVRLEKMRSTNSISHWDQVQRNLFTLVISEYILSNLSTTCTA